MVYYADLTPIDEERHHGYLAVGWLQKGMAFPVGEVDAGIAEKLLILADEAHLQTRGYHECQFCDLESPIYFYREYYEHGRLGLGSAEIHVTGRDGRKFAAPDMIVHYIVDHDYRPPSEFLDAIMSVSA